MHVLGAVLLAKHAVSLGPGPSSSIYQLSELEHDTEALFALLCLQVNVLNYGLSFSYHISLYPSPSPPLLPFDRLGLGMLVFLA